MAQAAGAATTMIIANTQRLSCGLLDYAGSTKVNFAVWLFSDFSHTHICYEVRMIKVP